jgi:hypothetical protein
MRGVQQPLSHADVDVELQKSADEVKRVFGSCR